MSSLRKDLRSDLEKAVVKARDLAEAAATAALQSLAVDQPKPFPHMDADARALRTRLRERGRAAGDVRDDFTTAQTIGHLAGLVGYEHWHRMIFARFLAENGLLLEPEHQVALSLDDVQELAREEGMDLWQLAGAYAQRMLPEVFRNDDPALEVTLAREDRTKLEKFLADLDPAIFTASDSLGWTYQFWQSKRKEEVNKSGVKIGADEISPVTQLFTEDYMVDFLLDNTLGAWWAARCAAISNFKFQISNCLTEADARKACALPGCEWKYLRFVPPASSSSSSSSHSQCGQEARAPLWTPAAGSFEGWPKSAAELKCLDPCCGSGHFLVGMFERLVALRMAEEDLDEIAAVAAVIRDNLFGLEIDPRCTQIGAFSLALAAWRRVGHCRLPAMNVACSGLAPNTREADWLAIAGDNGKLRRGMERLYRLFQNAPVLGSLINPRAGGGDLLEASFHELQPLLEKALAQEEDSSNSKFKIQNPQFHEMAVTAHGLAKAAEILAGQFTLVATNVPFLGRAKQDETLQHHLSEHFTEAQGDLATAFICRCISLASSGGRAAIVTPQSWLYSNRNGPLRELILSNYTWSVVARLGPGAFETISGEVVNVALLIISQSTPSSGSAFTGIDVSDLPDPAKKAAGLLGLNGKYLSSANQFSQLSNPKAAITLQSGGSSFPLLDVYCSSLAGATAGDKFRFSANWWEIDGSQIGHQWELYQGSPVSSAHYCGRELAVRWENERGAMAEFAASVRHLNHVAQNWLRGKPNWKKRGIAVGLMAQLPYTLYSGEIYDCGCCAVVPHDEALLPAVYAFIESGQYLKEVRALNQGLAVSSTTTFTKVPFDVSHWQKVAAEKYPNGLPKPFSSDPTQWLFNGHPAGADQPLQVAVARLLGYRWPRQTGSSFPDCPALGPDGLEPFCDQDGIVCLTPLRGEAKAAERLRKVLDAAYADADWNERQLLAAAGAKSTNLEDWLRDEFFEQHAKLFHHRPFIWHVWDGRPDGFHALVNYHRLAAPDGAGHKLLETLTYAYLGDWIRRQQDDANNNVPGAESRLEAATILQQELKHILAGEPPYDLFVRWKPLHQQPIGWHPDLNDGVRLNLRPFLYAKDVKKKGAGILRWQPNVKWTKDRGTEPQRPKTDFPWFWTWDEKTRDFQGSAKFDGNRWNDLHYSTATKQAARAAHEKKGTEA